MSNPIGNVEVQKIKNPDGTFGITAVSPVVLGKVLSKAVTDPYASAVKVTVQQGGNRVIIHIKENNANAIKYKILTSPDDVTYETLIADILVAKNASAYEVLSDPWLYIDVQLANNVAGSSGTGTVFILRG